MYHIVKAEAEPRPRPTRPASGQVRHRGPGAGADRAGPAAGVHRYADRDLGLVGDPVRTGR